MVKKTTLAVVVLTVPFLLSGCIAAAVGAGAAAGGYVLAKDKGSAGTYADDSIITSKIKSRYIADINLKSYNISVSTYEGVVVLTGSVPNEGMRQKAIEIARNTANVRSVNVTNFAVVP
ncbi:MAG: periplasmic protein [Gammaproteobacteria bacterium]|jgi:osmotically-inducible protein OsmY|nr:periplasmic protein [Gammaproteobacteria bacterium]